jgi:putative ABC transport system permease protein
VDSGAFEVGGISPQMAKDLQAVPEVAAVASMRIATVAVDGEVIQGFDGWSDEVGQLFHLGVIAGSVDNLGADGLAVSKTSAASHHWTVGSVVPVTFAATGDHNFTVKAIYDRSVDMVGAMFTSTAALEANQPDQLDAVAYVKLADGVDVASARRAIEAVTSQYPAGELMTKGAYVESVNANVDTILTLIYALLALAVFIALVGIANTLALSTFERRRELGLLRTVGMSRRQVRSMVRQEATLISTFGAVMGLGIGLLFGWALVKGMADEGITELVFPTTSLVVVMLVAVVAGVAASLRPARRAAQLDVLSAISSA